MMAGILIVAGSLSATWSASASPCVPAGDVQSLLYSIEYAEAFDHTPIDIKVEQGTYVQQGGIDGDFAVDVRILGGYLPTPTHTCDESQRTSDASKTQIRLSGAMNLTSNDRLTLENLTISSQLPNGSSGVFVGGGTNDNIVMNNVRITNVQSSSYVFIGGSSVSTGDIRLTNVQFDNMHRAPGGCAVVAVLGGVSDATINHATVDLASGDFCVRAGYEDGRKHVAVWNSILWDWANPATGGSVRTLHDLNDEGVSFYLYDVDYRDFHVSPADSVTFDSSYPSVQVDPLWTNPAGGDFSIGNSSVANAGTIDAPGGEPPKDILGADRRIGSAPDMGAHESPFDDIAGGSTFTVTNTNDVADENSPLYAGSLRAAMQKATTINGPSRIKFTLPACPSVITLHSPLPLVWEPLIIDGYSMAGSSMNTDPSSFFNATLCVALQPAIAADTPSALIVPSGGHDASLTVKGLGFGGFSQAIQLWGGYSHQIVGNQFGGVMNGVQLFGFDTAGVRIETTGSVIVGGSNVADHNVFQNANSAGDAAGVLVGVFTDNTQPVCQIVGNLFGITPDGFSAIPNNKYGILLQGNGCLVQGNRMAGNIKDAIYILGGSNHVIQNNVIGPAMFFGQDFSNPGAGIRITADGANNIIGAPPGFGGSYYANDIKDMDLGGVVIGGDGPGNSVRGNRISDNGLATGLNLDLGLDGPTANDPGDIDTGANGLMNYPKPHGFHWVNGTPVSGTFNIAADIIGLLDLAPGQYQLDAYYDDTCGAAGRGGGGWAGGVAIDIAAGGGAAFDVPVTIPAYDAAHGRVSLTATSIAAGQNSTSEFSECLSVDSIFYDGLDR